MRRVILIQPTPQKKGGLEKYAERIAAGFVQRKDQLTILSPSSFSLIRWPKFLRLEQFDRSVQKWVQEHPADLVFGIERTRKQTHLRAGNGVHAAYLKSRLLSEGKLKYGICKYNPLHRKILDIEKKAFENRSLKKIFTNSHMVEKQILERFEVDPRKIQVIHNGVEWEEMEAPFSRWKEGRKTVLQTFGLNPDQHHFLFIGNGYLRKGLDPLMEGLALLSRNDIHLSVVGKEKRIGRYREKAKKLGLERSIRFFGWQKEISPFYQLADTLVIPSFYDPFANVTIEAIAMGVFVLSSKYNGGSEIITEQNGALIDNLFDPTAVASSLLRALQKPKTDRFALSCRNSVKHLDFSQQIHTMIDACG